MGDLEDQALADTPLVQKGRCQDCPCYTDCPRMRGEDICYSLAQIDRARLDKPSERPVDPDSGFTQIE